MDVYDNIVKINDLCDIIKSSKELQDSVFKILTPLEYYYGTECRLMKIERSNGWSGS